MRRSVLAEFIRLRLISITFRIIVVTVGIQDGEFRRPLYQTSCWCSSIVLATSAAFRPERRRNGLIH
ncbi:hypothetical protein [Schlesneria paludicola]|uniref:hypothetical protein n=1 Tax=Schlesneria paludicola TaxID=360056 RepID=UPI00029A5684|nr:hypothetical protein [Schlesneria paludicola]